MGSGGSNNERLQANTYMGCFGYQATLQNKLTQMFIKCTAILWLLIHCAIHEGQHAALQNPICFAHHRQPRPHNETIQNGTAMSSLWPEAAGACAPDGWRVGSLRKLWVSCRDLVGENLAVVTINRIPLREHAGNNFISVMLWHALQCPETQGSKHSSFTRCVCKWLRLHPGRRAKARRNKEHIGKVPFGATPQFANCHKAGCLGNAHRMSRARKVYILPRLAGFSCTNVVVKVRIYACMCIFVYTCHLCTCVQGCMHACMYAFILCHTYIHMWVCIYICIHTHTYSSINTCGYVYVRI